MPTLLDSRRQVIAQAHGIGAWWMLPLLPNTDRYMALNDYQGRRVTGDVADLQSLLRHTGMVEVIVTPNATYFIYSKD